MPNEISYHTGNIFTVYYGIACIRLLSEMMFNVLFFIYFLYIIKNYSKITKQIMIFNDQHLTMKNCISDAVYFVMISSLLVIICVKYNQIKLKSPSGNTEIQNKAFSILLFLQL